MAPKLKVTVSVDKSLFRSSDHNEDIGLNEPRKRTSSKTNLFLPIQSKSSFEYFEPHTHGDKVEPETHTDDASDSLSTFCCNNAGTKIDTLKDKPRVTWRSGILSSVSIGDDTSPHLDFNLLTEEFMKRLRSSSNSECIDGVYVYPKFDSEESHPDDDESPILTY